MRSVEAATAANQEAIEALKGELEGARLASAVSRAETSAPSTPLRLPTPPRALPTPPRQLKRRVQSEEPTTPTVAAAATSLVRATPSSSSDAAVYALVSGIGGTIATAGRDAEVRLLSSETGRCVSRMRGHTERVFALARCGDEQAPMLASASGDATVRLWRPEEARCTRRLRGHQGAVYSLASHRSLLLSGAADGCVRIWETASGSCVGTLWRATVRDSHGSGGGSGGGGGGGGGGDGNGAIQALAITRGDTLAAGSWGGALRLWDLRRCALAASLEDAHGGGVCALVHADGSLCSSGSDGLIKLWDVRTGCSVASLGSRNTGAVYALAAREHLVISGGYDLLVKVWDARMRKCLNELAGHSGAIRSLASEAGRVLSGATDGTVRAWDKDDLLGISPTKRSVRDEVGLSDSPEAKPSANGAVGLPL